MRWKMYKYEDLYGTMQQIVEEITSIIPYCVTCRRTTFRWLYMYFNFSYLFIMNDVFRKYVTLVFLNVYGILTFECWMKYK